MIFNSITYLLFLIIVVSVYWTVTPRFRLWLLFASSFTFYAFWRIDFAFVMIFSASVDYYVAHKIYSSISNTNRRNWLLVSLTINLGLLFYFKYLLFFVDNIYITLDFLGVKSTNPAWSIVLPLGISFYTFQTISYTVDVYRKFIEPEKSYLRYLCFVTFFPQLVAGPIVRAKELITQLDSIKYIDLTFLADGIRRILFGLFLKVVLADNIAPFVDVGFQQDTHTLSALDVLTLSFLFGFQIYFDFSGYSHIAIGSARIMGITLPENFNFPYIATSPKEFWQRWHITLSSWIRDYLYLPLVGSQVQDRSTGGLANATVATADTAKRSSTPLLLTWMIMGLWHGANWTFVFWGVYHAIVIIIYRFSSYYLQKKDISVNALVSWALTLLIMMLSWIPFRATSLETTMEMYFRLFSIENYMWLGMRENTYIVTALLVLTFVTTYFVKTFWERHKSYNSIIEIPVMTCVYSVLIFSIFIYLRPLKQFIYFQF